MSEPWDSLRAEVLGVLKAQIADFAADVRPELQEFLAQKAKEAAKWKWESIHAGSPEKCLEAETNLRHLAAQVKGEAARLNLVATARGKELLGKILEVGLDMLVKISPKLLGS